MTFRHLSSVLGAAVALAACGDGGTAPVRQAASTHVVVSANEQPLPALVHERIWPDDNEHTQTGGPMRLEELARHRVAERSGSSIV